MKRFVFSRILTCFLAILASQGPAVAQTTRPLLEESTGGNADTEERLHWLESQTERQQGQLDRVSSEVKQLQSSVSDLQRQVTRQQRNGSGAPPQGEFIHVETFRPQGYGRVALTNLHGESVQFMVNSRWYTVGPGEIRTLIGQPTGVLRYQVYSPTWGYQPARLTQLAENATLALTAR